MLYVYTVTSAERPVTETEGKLLGYIKEWGKKVVMVLNKVCVSLSVSMSVPVCMHVLFFPVLRTFRL